MKKSIPLTGSSSVSVDLEKFRATMNTMWQKTLASGKVKILDEGAFVRRDRGSTGPISEKAAAAINEFRQELNSIAAPSTPAPVQVSTAPPPRRAPPPKPAFKRPSALQK